MRKILLNVKKRCKHKGFVALVDDKDYENVSKYNWYAHIEGKRVYAYTNTVVGGKRTTIKMHRLILGLPNYMIDHKDKNGLNNQRKNLRRCNKTQNAANATLQVNNKSGFRGVCFDKSKNAWLVQLKYRGAKVFSKRFKNINEAALAYNEQAIKYFGEFANQNNIKINVPTKK